MKTLTRLALATFLATGLTTAGWAWGTDPGGGCCGTAAGKYRTPSGKLMNVFPARKKATAARPRATMPAKPAAPKPRKKVNFTLKKK